MKERFKSLSHIVINIVIVSTAIYFFIIGFFGDQIPLPALIKFRQVALIFFTVGYFLVIPASLTSHFPKALSIILALFAVPIFCVLSYISASYPERINNSGQLGDNNYHISASGIPLEHFTLYTFYKCDSNNLNCKIIEEDYDSLYKTDLIIDETHKEVHFFVNSWLRFTDVMPIRNYDLLYAEWMGQDIYWLAYYPEILTEFVFYRCNNQTRMDCEILPFHYSKETVQDFKSAELVVDNESKTMSIYIDGELIYIYSSNPQCFVENCSLVGK